jgi:deoxyribodipyrimidine photo-lyase
MSDGAARVAAPSRLRVANDAPVHAGRACVLYWMTASRRTRHSVPLEHAVARANALRKPLLVFEPLRCDYRHASDRLHRFVLDGMHDNARACAAHGVDYFAYVEPEAGAARGLLAALAADACVVVTDDFPAFFLPRMLAAAARRLDVRVEAVDGNGLLPMRGCGRLFRTALSFRAWWQHQLRAALAEAPHAEPLAALAAPAGRGVRAHGLADAVRARWSPRSGDAAPLPEVAALPIDHSVPVVAGVHGGATAGRAVLDAFVAERLADYATRRNRPAVPGSGDAATRSGGSGLSPWLHFGHVGAHEVFAAVAAHESWTPARLSRPRGGRREGFLGMSAGAEAFLDQCITWRELGINACVHDPAVDRYESLPPWARATLAEHAADARPAVYSPAEFAAAATHDPLWNAAQRQLLREGRIHNYLRMLWGKKVIEWSPDPQAALATLCELNDRYALDGRDPNSLCGIFWCFGRYDRPWGPQRPVFGLVRYMSSGNTRRKLDVAAYLRRFAA